MEIPTVFEIIAWCAGKVALHVWRNPEAAQGWYDWASKSSDANDDKPSDDNDVFPSIVILGAGGVGKTTIGKILNQDLQQPVALADYNESLDTEVISTRFQNGKRIAVLPGQEHRRRLVWPEAIAGIISGDIEGVILVDCFGYHSIGEISLRSMAEWNKDLASFRDQFLKKRRNEESEIVEKLLTALEQRQRPIWFLHVITKEDLWFSHSEEVERHSKSGRYLKLSNTVRGITGSRFEQCRICLSITNVESKDQGVVFIHDQAYDQRKVERSYSELLNHVKSLMSNKDERK